MVKKRDTPCTNQNHETKLPIAPTPPLKKHFFKLSENAKIQKSQEVHTYYIHGYYQYRHTHTGKGQKGHY